MSELTSRERVLRAVNWKAVDRLPVFSATLLAPQIINRNFSREFLLDSEALAEVYYKQWEYFKSDIVMLSVATGEHEALGADMYWPKNDYPMIRNPIIKTHADADNLKVPDLRKNDLVQSILKAIRIIRKKVGNHIMIGSISGGPFNTAGLLFGTESLMSNVKKDPELVDKVCKVVVDASIQYAELQVEAGADLIFMPDATSSPSCLSPAQYRERALPHITRSVQGFKKAGAIAMYHPCGGEYPIIDQVSQTGADILYFSELVDLSVSQKIFVGRHCVAGGVDPSGTLFLGSPEEVDENVRKIVDSLKFKTGAIVMPGCGLSPNIPFENVKAMVDAVKKYGKGKLR
ncbi:uroporphyrinogen decarboxylase family protein [Clostridium sp. JNZ X4-2]